jgi:hypothetical protein
MFEFLDISLTNKTRYASGTCQISSLEFGTCSSNEKPITVAARSKAWTVFVRSNTGIMGSNPTRVMDVCVRLLFFVLLCK